MEFITNFISLFLYFSFLYLPFSAESKYDLINYWNSTGLTGEDINDLYKTSVDDQLAVLYVKEQEKFGEPTNALKVVIDFFYLLKFNLISSVIIMNLFRFFEDYSLALFLGLSPIWRAQQSCFERPIS